MSDQLLTAELVANDFHVKAKTVHQWVRDGALACVQVSARRRLFLPEQVEEFIKSRTVVLPNTIDKNSGNRLPSAPKKGGSKSSGETSVRALREEMRSW